MSSKVVLTENFLSNYLPHLIKTKTENENQKSKKKTFQQISNADRKKKNFDILLKNFPKNYQSYINEKLKMKKQFIVKLIEDLEKRSKANNKNKLFTCLYKIKKETQKHEIIKKNITKVLNKKTKIKNENCFEKPNILLNSIRLLPTIKIDNNLQKQNSMNLFKRYSQGWNSHKRIIFPNFQKILKKNEHYNKDINQNNNMSLITIR